MFPGFYILFAFIILHEIGRSAEKLKWGRPGTIHHVNDVRWMWGGRRGRGPTAKQCTGVSVQALYCSFGLETLAWSKLLGLTSKKLAFKFSTYIFEYRSLPPPPTSNSHPLMWWMLPDLLHFSLVFRSRVLLWMQTEGKNGGGLGTRLVHMMVFHRPSCYIPHCR